MGLSLSDIQSQMTAFPYMLLALAIVATLGSGLMNALMVACYSPMSR